jgi:hypothetical protein
VVSSGCGRRTRPWVLLSSSSTAPRAPAELPRKPRKASRGTAPQGVAGGVSLIRGSNEGASGRPN